MGDGGWEWVHLNKLLPPALPFCLPFHHRHHFHATCTCWEAVCLFYYFKLLLSLSLSLKHAVCDSLPYLYTIWYSCMTFLINSDIGDLVICQGTALCLCLPPWEFTPPAHTHTLPPHPLYPLPCPSYTCTHIWAGGLPPSLFPSMDETTSPDRHLPLPPSQGSGDPLPHSSPTGLRWEDLEGLF